MSDGARVESIDALRHMRIALFKFAESTSTALSDAESEMRQMLNWLENDLAATSKDWIIAFWHQPPYSKGTHDSDREGDLIEMRENALPRDR